MRTLYFNGIKTQFSAPCFVRRNLILRAVFCKTEFNFPRRVCKTEFNFPRRVCKTEFNSPRRVL